MATQSIEVRDEEHWHELRKQNVGASEVACILGMSKFKTKWRLYQEKRGALEPDKLDKDDAVLTGKYMEPALAKWAEEKFDWQLRKVNRYLVDTALKAGASLDYETASGPREPVEIKFHTGWGSDDPDHQWEYTGDQITQAPVQYLLQLQHQMMLSGAKQGWLVAYLGGSVRRMCVPRSESIIAHITVEIAKFWTDVEEHNEPDVNWFADAEGVAKLMSAVTGGKVTHLDGKHAEYHLKRLSLAKRMAKRADEMQAEAKGQLWLMADDAETAMVGDTRIDMGWQNGSPGRVVTQDMVGTRIGERAGWRRCQIRVSRKKG